MTTNTLPSMLHQRTLSNLSSTHEDLFSSITGLDDLAEGNGLDDDLSFDDVDDSLATDGTAAGKAGGPARKGKNRNSSSTAEKKATHNAVERARRESLNARFLVLADMLPGMTQVKRASKAAIVNKSIDLIREMQLTEHKLAKENEQLKAELEALRLRTGSPASATNASTAGVAASATASSVSNANIAALAAAQEAARQQVQAQQAQAAHAQSHNLHHQHALFGAAGMQHPMQLAGMPMMPHIPAAAMAASLAAAAAAGNPALLHQQQQQNNHSQASAQQHQHASALAQQIQASQAIAAAAAAAAAASGSSTGGAPASAADIGSQLFPGVFSGLFNGAASGPGAFESLDAARSESGSPASYGSFGGSQGAAASQFAHGLFDLPAMTSFNADGASNNKGSPAASNGGGSVGYHQSPPGTVASLAGSERTQQSATSSAGASSSATTTAGSLTHNGSAPSPASSNGVPTPPSTTAYSPIGLSHLAATPQSTHSQVTNSNNGASVVDPVIAAFDGSSDAAYLAAQFAPNDLAKAQHDLQAFIAYQQRMAFAPNAASAQQPHTPTLEYGSGGRHSSVGASQMSPSSLYPPSSAGGQGYGFGSQQQNMSNQLSSSAYGGAGNPSLVAGMCGPSAASAGMNGMPAWQMMMAQHQAMVAAYGGQQF